jgi:hypothetical protein
MLICLSTVMLLIVRIWASWSGNPLTSGCMDKFSYFTLSINILSVAVIELSYILVRKFTVLLRVLWE